MRVTREAVGRAVPVSDDLFRVLRCALGDERADRRRVRRHGGAAVAPVAPRAARNRSCRTPASRRPRGRRAGPRLVRLDPAATLVWLARRGMRLDFGGIAKGYAADRALDDAARRTGCSRALVVAGGDVAVGDPPPGERGWRVAIAPFDSRTPAATAVADAGERGRVHVGRRGAVGRDRRRPVLAHLRPAHGPPAHRAPAGDRRGTRRHDLGYAGDHAVRAGPGRWAAARETHAGRRRR